MTRLPPPSDRIGEAAARLRRGAMALLTDRHGVSAVVGAAEAASPRMVNFMLHEARGLLCAAMPLGRLEALGLRSMVPGPHALDANDFAISVDLELPDNTGISAGARAACLRRLAAADLAPDELRTPGHVFPLRTAPGGVLEAPRAGEAAVALMDAAGLVPAAVLCSVLDEHGAVAGPCTVQRMAAAHDLPLVTVEEVVVHRRRSETHVERIAETTVPVDGAVLRALGYRVFPGGAEHVVLLPGAVDADRPVPVYVHSECVLGDVLGSRACSCATSFQYALTALAASGRGALVYLRSPDAGAALSHLTRAVGHEPGQVDAASQEFVVAAIMEDLGICQSGESPPTLLSCAR